MPAPGFGSCVWCGEVIWRFYVDDHGTRYHIECYDLRGRLTSPLLYFGRGQEAAPGKPPA